MNLKSTVDRVEQVVEKGDSIWDIFKRQGIDGRTSYRFFQDVKPVFNLKRIRAGKKYVLILDGQGLRSFRYEIDSRACLKVRRGKNNRFSGKIEPMVFTLKRKLIRGTVRDSLFSAILDLGEGPELADRLAGLYEYDFDFNRDIQPGDTFSVLFQKRYREGVFSGYGPILAAGFQNRNRMIRIVRYTDPGGKTDYYHPDGRAVKKMFLRCPLPFMRISSGYGFRRHPVLGFSARHRGIDLKAPPGTRIRATAGGVVSRVGSDRIRGRYVIIRHPNYYDTHYYHLRGFMRGIGTGKAVSQGEVIGFVGRSGRSTGYHLHYGVKKNGRFINPLSLKSPSKNPVEKEYLEAFKKYSSALFFLLSEKPPIPIPERVQEILLTGIENDTMPAVAPSVK